MAILQVDQVVKQYNNTLAVDHVSFQASEGRLLGLLGPNGAGKTSTIRMITYITTPDTGQVLFQGKPVGAWSQERMGYMPEERGLYKKMKIGEQLVYLAMLKGMSKTAAQRSAEVWLARFGAADWAQKKTEELSKGMQQKVQFIATILHDPDLLILDEPFSGLDPVNAELLREVILEFKAKGKTIVFASHRMEQVEQMCDDICLIAKGKVVLSGGLREVKRSFGRNQVVLGFEGSDLFLNDLVGVEGVNLKDRSAGHAVFNVATEAHAQAILHRAVAASTVIRFELVEPTLNEIFIKTVGEN